MTNEQRESVERLRKGIDDILFATLYSQEEMNTDIDTVLALIKEQQEEIEGLKDKEVLIKRYFKKCDLIKQKDKQIDLMAEELWREFYLTYMNGYGINSKEELKQYFERKVENER